MVFMLQTVVKLCAETWSQAVLIVLCNLAHSESQLKSEYDQQEPSQPFVS